MPFLPECVASRCTRFIRRSGVAPLRSLVEDDNFQTDPECRIAARHRAKQLDSTSFFVLFHFPT